MPRSRRALLAAAGAVLAGCSGDGDGGGGTVTPAAVPEGSGDATIAEVRAARPPDPDPDPDPPSRVPAAHLEASLDRLLALVETAGNFLGAGLADAAVPVADRLR